MSRDAQQILDAMAAAARLTRFDEDHTWRDALFEPAGDSWRLSSVDHPDRVALAALAREYARADLHAAQLPHRLHVEWLERIIAVPRLPAMPDEVIASATVDPDVAPVPIPAGTALRGGKDAWGNERRYITSDALTAHGATVTGLRALVPGGPGLRPGAALSAPEYPLSVPGDDAEAVAAPAATHVLRVSSDVLGFPSGRMKVDVAFSDAHGVDALRASGRWWHPRPDGTMHSMGTGMATSGGVELTLDGGCVDPEGGAPWVECRIDPAHAVPQSLTFRSVTVAVTERRGVVPDAAFVNAGAVDVSTEFEPFLANAAQGDAFYVRSDEALAKRLRMLKIRVDQVKALGGGHRIPVTHALSIHEYNTLAELYQGQAWFATDWAQVADHGIIAEDVLRAIDHDVRSGPVGGGASGMRIMALSSDDRVALTLYEYRTEADAKIFWQRRVDEDDGAGPDGEWEDLSTPMSRLETRTATFSPVEVRDSEHGSASHPVAGERGHYVRAYIRSGDLGWKAYQKGLADFATRAVTNSDDPGAMPTPLEPALCDRLRIDYETHPLPASRVESWSGWRHQVHAGGAFSPFRVPVDDVGTPGMVAIGLDISEAAAGSSVSLYLEVDSAAACTAELSPEASWQWWDGNAWHALRVADATHCLRESGLVRFVAPHGWALGCTDLTTDSGRWVRLITSAPRALGSVTAVIPDAVVARYASSAPDPQADPTSATPLAPGDIKGAVTPIRGVKRVTNLASLPGRAPEDDAAYASRASVAVRHRGRALAAWDYEELGSRELPEVAAIRCLPHTDDSGHAPGTVGLVVVPDQPDVPQPRPSLSLAGRIADALTPTMPLSANLAVLCARYAPVSVHAQVMLRSGIAAIEGRDRVTAALEKFLHPSATARDRWGIALYASSVIAALERLPEVDAIEDFAMRSPDGTAVDHISVDPCRGLYCSTGAHDLTFLEQL